MKERKGHSFSGRLTPNDVRQRIARLSLQRDKSLTELSRAIGRNVAYMQQFVERGTPKVLAEHDRRILAEILGVSEQELGGPAPVRSTPTDINDPDLIDEIAKAMWESTESDQLPESDHLAWEKAFHWQDAFRRNAAAALRKLRELGHL